MHVKVIFKSGAYVILPCSSLDRATKAVADTESAMNARRAIRLGDVGVFACEEIAAVHVVAEPPPTP